MLMTDDSAGNRVQLVWPTVYRAHRNGVTVVRFLFQLIDNLCSFSFVDKEFLGGDVELRLVFETNFPLGVARGLPNSRQYDRRDNADNRGHSQKFQ